MSNIRIKTDVGVDKYLKVNLEQDFDFLEILSLKLSQEDVYRRFNSDYGVVVGRVIVNNGLGVPNAKVSLFIPLNDSDSEEVKSLYPFNTANDEDFDGVRYNLLPKDYQGDCHTPVGTFPKKREVLDNNIIFEVYDKYYKFTTTTNNAGDFMLFGVPVGNHIINIDVDLSDIGQFSQKPYDFIEQGNPENLFKSSTVFLGSKNLNSLTQLKNQKAGVNIIPFWGEEGEIGITRIDMDLNYNLVPSAIFVGSIFGDNEKNSLNKNCRPRKDLGKLCETVSASGTINMIRKDIDGNTQKFDVSGGNLIDEFGAWAYQIPMNLDYVVTDEFGELIPSEDTNKGVPTRAKVRFKIGMDDTGGEGRIRSRAKFLVPHNPKTADDIDYNFNSDTKSNNFTDLSWNKIYTVRNHITRIQSACSGGCADNRRMIGVKDVDDCVGNKNPFPFNKLDGDFNPLFLIICLIVGIILMILELANRAFSLITRVRLFGRVRCVALDCDGVKYAPGCSGSRAKPDGTKSTSKDALEECYKIQLASALNIFEFDFYNDWVNGTLFSFLLKYKKKKNNEKFCSVDVSEDSYIVDTLINGNLKNHASEKIYKGFIKSFKGELFYAPYDKDRDYILYATDITCLGAINKCDWEGKPSFHEYLLPTSYKIPPLTNTDEPNVSKLADSNPNRGLLFTFSCTKLNASDNQMSNIRRLCEIGVGLDEDRNDEPNGVSKNNSIGDEDIDNQFVRDCLIVSNSNTLSLTTTGLNSGFNGSHYKNYRDFGKRTVKQARGNSFYMYFGTAPNNSAIDKMNAKYFTSCEQVVEDEFIIEGVISDVTYLGGNDGSINISIIDGFEPFTYLWSNGEITEGVSNLTAGEYTVSVTDDNGSVVKKTFIVSQPKPIKVEIVVNTTRTPLSSDGTLTLSSIIGGNGNYFVTIVGPTNNPTTQTVNNPIPNFTFTGLASGTYTLTVVDTSNVPLTYNSVFEILKPPKLETTITFTSPECYAPDYDNDAEINIRINGGIPPYLVQTVGPTFVNESGGTETYSSTLMNHLSLPSGTFSITITDLFGQVVTGSGAIVMPTALKIRFYEIKVITLPSRISIMSSNALANFLNAQNSVHDLSNQHIDYYFRYSYFPGGVLSGMGHAFHKFIPNSVSGYGVCGGNGLNFDESNFETIATNEQSNFIIDKRRISITSPRAGQLNGFGDGEKFDVFKVGSSVKLYEFTIGIVYNFDTNSFLRVYSFPPNGLTAGDKAYLVSHRDGCESNEITIY